MIGTSDQSGWLAEACKILLLLLHGSMLLDSTSVQRCRSTSGLPSPPAVIATLLTNMSAPET